MKKNFSLYGYNYKTPDGTAIRDYINVLDIADIISFLTKKKIESGIYNCGYGKGYSVLEILNKFQNHFKYKFTIQRKKKRPGDVPYLVCDNKKITKLGWRPKYSNLYKCFNESNKYFRKYFFLKN
jgi:UDP-glucose 4-epimerase